MALVVAFVLLVLFFRASSYELVRDYSGSTFFDDWDFYGDYDNLTLGDVWWLDRQDAMTQGLAYINSAGNAIIKVDNLSDVAFNQKRNSVRITSQDSYAVGSLWIIDVVHIPFGCSVWPAFWTMGADWPNDGEIDIIEGINVVPNNQMALHTTPGCSHPPSNQQYQISETIYTDCSVASGCTVLELQENSYYTGLAEAGGAVWATQFDVSGIFIWFWSRPNVPASVTGSTTNSSLTLDISQWGPPSASFPATFCNITEFFTPQKLVLDITLCGSWAGLPQYYFPSCGNSTGTCYADSVVGPGETFDDAYFEISYVRAYTTPVPVPTPRAIVSIPTYPTPTALSAYLPSTPTASSLLFSAGERLEIDYKLSTILLLIMFGYFGLF